MSNNMDNFVSKYSFGLLFIGCGFFLEIVGLIGYYVWGMSLGVVHISIGLVFLGIGLLLLIIIKLFSPYRLTGDP